MTTGPSKGLYWYVALAATFLLVPSTATSLVAIKQNIVGGTFWENWKEMMFCIFMIGLHFMCVSDVLKYREGYTTTTTTKYQLFKCRESGKEETFMMFADTEEELEKFFDITQPCKRFFIEPAEMAGKSIQMKVFHTGDE